MQGPHAASGTQLSNIWFGHREAKAFFCYCINIDFCEYKNKNLPLVTFVLNLQQKFHVQQNI